MKTLKTKTLYNKQVAVNSNKVEELIRNNENLWVYHKDAIMVLTPSQLKEGKVIDPIRYKDKFKPHTYYQLLYYKWEPNRETEKQKEFL